MMLDDAAFIIYTVHAACSNYWVCKVSVKADEDNDEAFGTFRKYYEESRLIRPFIGCYSTSTEAFIKVLEHQ